MKLKYEIGSMSTTSRLNKEMRYEIERILCERIYKDLKLIEFPKSVFIEYLEIELDNIQQELNYLTICSAEHNMTHAEQVLMETATKEMTLMSLICLELYMELTK